MIVASSLPLWITEDITWPILWGLLVVGILGFSWFVSRQNALLLGLAILIAGMGTLIFIENRVITDREYLVDVIRQMTRSVRANDVDGVAQFVHFENKKLKQRIYSDVGSYHVENCTLIGFNRQDLELDSNPPTAEIGFAVWGSGTRGGSGPYTANVVVELDFQKTGDQWWLTGYKYRPSNTQTWFGGSHK